MATPGRSASVDGRTQRLRGASWRPSPNQDARPDGTDVSLLVVHAIALPPETFGAPPASRDGSEPGYIDQLFANTLDCNAHPYFDGLRDLKVSAHLCIFRSGRIHQYVAFHRRAWHAGVSRWDGRERCNDFSIGIELEGSDTQPFEDAQYEALIDAVAGIRRAFPLITAERVVGHSDVAPGRKTDPGPHFDWPRLRASLTETAGATTP